MKIKINDIFKVVLLFIGLLGFCISFSYWLSWSWKYYQVYTYNWEHYKDYIFNGIYNDNLSSYVIDQGVLSSSNTNNISRKEWDIMLILQENWEFNVLKWFTVTQYNWNSTYFTANYSWTNFASTICSVFSNGNLISVYQQSWKLYKNLTVWGVTKKIEIAKLSTGVTFLKKDANIYVKVLNGFTNCNQVKNNWILWYRVAYYTRYKRDVSPPSAKLESLYFTWWSPYDLWQWANQTVYYKIKCIDNPTWIIIGNAGCKVENITSELNTSIISGDAWIYYTFYDQSKWSNGLWNVKNWYIDTFHWNKLIVPIDTTPPLIENNYLLLKWTHDITSWNTYYLDKDVSSYSILADDYTLSFKVSDRWWCNGNIKCKWISWIKSIDVKLGGTLIKSKIFPTYNTTKWEIVPDEKNVSLQLNLTGVVSNKKLSIAIKDFAGNTFIKSWNITIKPNKPIENNFVLTCLHWCLSKQYATNDNDDYYQYTISLKDRFWNLVTKRISNISLNKTLDADTYDWSWINDLDKNAVTEFDVKYWNGNNWLNKWMVSLKLRSIVPGVFYKKFTIKFPKFDKNGNIITWEFWIFNKNFWKSIGYKYPINAWNISIYDLSWNNVPTTWLLPTVEYEMRIPINIDTGTFSTNDYSYNISDININTFKSYPTNLYRITDITDISWNQKKSWVVYPHYLTFHFKYNYVWSWVMNKSIYFKFNPSISLTNNDNTWKYSLYPADKQLWTGHNIKFKFSIIWFKYTNGKTYAIWQWKKQLNIVLPKIRSRVRKNAYSYINSINPNTPTNWVYLVSWDYNLNLTNYNYLKNNNIKTLIIRNGNLIISTNIPKRLDIAVVENNKNKIWEIINSFNISDYLSEGNIIIEPNVTFIDGLLYADRSIIAWDYSWKPISVNNPNRLSLLSKQILFYWTLISKNTVWWSILWSDSKYTLPGWSTTSNLNIASYFDIAFLRLWNDWYNINSKYNDWKDDYVIIRLNPQLQLNPWKLLK